MQLLTGKSCDMFEFYQQSADTALSPSDAAMEAFDSEHHGYLDQGAGAADKADKAEAEGENKPGQSWSPRRSIYEVRTIAIHISYPEHIICNILMVFQRDLRGTASTVYNLVFGREARYRAVPYCGLAPPATAPGAVAPEAVGVGGGGEAARGRPASSSGSTSTSAASAPRLYHGLDVAWALDRLQSLVHPPQSTSGNSSSSNSSSGKGGDSGRYILVRDTELSLDLPSASLNP
jgi:uncharacterized membrane protein YgcG